MRSGARRAFKNADVLETVLAMPAAKGLVTLRTVDDLSITIRQNPSDASTIAEIFVSDCYLHKHLHLPTNPVILDVGGFVGDFALYAVKKLNAKRVIVCEPSPRNWELLLKNIADNGFQDRIEPVHKAVTDGRDVMMNINAPDDEQCMVSSYRSNGQPLTAVKGISIAELLRDHAVETVDLLKIDCEGGEFAILESTPSDVFCRIRNIVFEYHQIDGALAKLKAAKQQLRREGYALHMHRGLVFAWRS